MKWTTELRYKNYGDWDKDYIQDLIFKKENSIWKNHFHLEPQSGLLNDPNGFSYFDGKWHLFFQHFPFGAVHGLKSWSHATSLDLVNWEIDDIKLLPGSDFDSHGVYSGSAYPVGDDLFLFYTGNYRDKDWNRSAYQMTALMNKEGEIVKSERPVISDEAGYTAHFRDPMIFKDKGQFYTVIGAQDLDLKGHVVLYKAVDNNLENWQKIDDLHFSDLDLGFMVECPNLVFVDGRPVLLFCPQGMEEVYSENIYPQSYIVAEEFDAEGAKLTNPGAIENLDYGFDVYATQAFNAPDGRVLSVSWLGLPEIDYPTNDLGYQGSLSLVKELSLKDGKLYQYPVEEIKELRKKEIQASEHVFDKNTYEAEFTVDMKEGAEVSFYASDDNKEALKLTIANGEIKLDRSELGPIFAEDFGVTRSITNISSDQVKVNAFVDTSVIEIFINDGEYVLSSRVFPGEGQTKFQVKGATQVALYEM
ncbi:sucrose-6-phosphate hydrolase [Streptococcaceae bacterium ESL0687]|nr:sucrose-6-phosphate hydrolase [Streptococcaceae bacterium ESL0687]